MSRRQELCWGLWAVWEAGRELEFMELLRQMRGCQALEWTRSSHSLENPSLCQARGAGSSLGLQNPDLGGCCSLGLPISQLQCFAVGVAQAMVYPFPASPPGAAGCLHTQQTRAVIRPEQQQGFLGSANFSSKCLPLSWPHCAGNFRSLCNQSWINNNHCYA